MARLVAAVQEEGRGGEALIWWDPDEGHHSTKEIAP